MMMLDLIFASRKIRMLLMATMLLAYTGVTQAVPASLPEQDKIKVTGIVEDEDGPIIAANIIEKGTTNGTVSDSDGKFSISVHPNATLVISYIGYQEQEVAVAGRNKLHIRLAEDALSLDEVMVVAYGTQKKVTITGALSSIGTEDILKSPVSSMSNALAGKVTGLSSVQSTGQPGADNATLYVRGVGSLSTSLSQPLVLVDGVERSFNQLDPNDVENITVLKDASATAVFGVRGANGVILVTTKRGTAGKAKISFTTTTAVQMPSRIPEYANSYDYATAYVNAQLHDGVAESELAFSADVIEKFRTNSDPLTYPSTSWTDMMIRNYALQTQHNFNISGGSDRVKYFASLGVFTQKGLFETFDNPNDKGFQYNRYNYRINMDVGLTKTTSMKVNLGGYMSNKQEPNYNNGTYTSVQYLFRDIYDAVPFAGAGIVDGKWVITDQDLFSVGNYSDGLNPYYGKGYNNLIQNTLNFDFQLSQNLDKLTKGLDANLKTSYNSGVSITKRREGRMDKYEAIYNSDGEAVLKKVQDYQKLSYTESTSQSRNWYLEGSLNYQRDFGDHHVTGLAMYNQSMIYYPSGPTEFVGIPRAYIGFVGRITYDYKTRYLFDISAGYNGSENFAEGKRFGLFPAGSVGWIVSEEDFFSPLRNTINYLKFRGSYGIVGNDKVSDNSRFLYLADKYLVSSGSYSFGTNTTTLVAGALESTKGNQDVTWETSEKQNYGVDMKLLSNRLSLTFDYFTEHRKNILISRQVSPGYLAVSLPIANLGKVNNKGYEIELKWEDRIREVRYSIGAHLSYAKNTIVDVDEIDYPYDWMKQEGKSVGQEFGYVFDGYFTEYEASNYSSLVAQGDIASQGSGYTPLAGDVKYKDLNGDGQIDEKDVSAIGYPKYPLYSTGINLGISWRAFDLSMTWAGAFNVSRLLSRTYRVPYGESNNYSIMQYMIDDAWTPEKGDAAKAPALSFKSKSHNYMDSSLWLRDASYLRLKNIEFGYTFPSNAVKKLGIGSLRIFTSGYNLLTFDKLKIADPEADSEGLTYPLIKIVNFGVKVGF